MFTRRSLLLGAATLAGFGTPAGSAPRKKPVGRGNVCNSVRICGTRSGSPVPLIFLETDICEDASDVAAVQLLIALANMGLCSIVGANANSSNIYSASCLAALLNTTGYGSLPIGAYQGSDYPSTSSYTQQVAARFGTGALTRTSYPSGVNNLRAVLAAAPNNSVSIVSIGFLNNLKLLLASTADQYSSLNGVQLVEAKVNQFYLQGGYFTTGSEYNFNAGDTDGTASSYVVSNWPSSMAITGVDFNLGNNIVLTWSTGNPLTNPFVYAYNLYGALTRPSWDSLAVLYSVSGYQTLFGFEGVNGTNTIAGNGTNTWTSAAGNFNYLTNVASTSIIATTIDNLANTVT